MSQPLSPSPNPVDAAAALASTKAAQPDLTNRREIPLSSFDFLVGAYEATKRARRITTAVMVLIVLGGFINVFGAIRTNFEVREVRADINQVKAERDDFIASFGTDPSGLSTEVILDRDQLLSGGIALAANQQGDFLTLLTDLSEIEGANARVSRFTFGSSVVTEGTGAPAQPAAEETSSGKTPDKPATVAVSIAVTGDSLADVIALVESIQQLPGLTDVRTDREGTTATVTGSVVLNRPPKAVLDRLLALGVSINSASPAVAEEEAQEEGS